MAISKNAYQDFLKRVSSRLVGLGNYADYTCFEKDWLYYFEKIYLPNCNKKLPPRIIIAESAPGGVYVRNVNFIFHTTFLKKRICSTRDVYLYRYYRGVFPATSIKSVKALTKEQALIDLAKQNILILDLLPTHGITIKSKERTKIKTTLLGSIDYSKISQFKNQKIDYVFSVPPRLYDVGMCNIHLGPNFTEFGNVNSGQGHAPSIKAIRSVIAGGF